MENKRLVKHITLLLAISCLFTGLTGCNKNKDQEITDEMITQTVNASNPSIDVNVGPYEHLERREVEDVTGYNQTLSSSTILDMPIDGVINVIYNAENESVQALPSLFNNLVNANKELETISIVDRDGNHLTKGNNNLLSTDGSKISISNPTGYVYGEVYKISIKNADYLAFEHKDPSIRTLTIEIEDDPSEAKTYNEKEIKGNIFEFDRDKVSNKKVDAKHNLYSFEYASSLPGPIERNDVFYVTKHGNPDPKLDFYGIFFYIKYVDDDFNKIEVTYRAPEMDDIYNKFHLKGEQEMSFDDAEILLNDELALQSFKGSAFANGVARACLPLVNNDLDKLSNILSNFQIHVDVDHYNNRVSMKFHAGIYGYKIANKYYLTIDFGYEKITDYTIDFDVSIKTKLKIIPVGVNYKIKCIEDTQEIFYIKCSLSYSLVPSGEQSDKDFTEDVAKEIEAIKNNKKASAISAFGDDPQAKAATSGSRTTWPIIIVDFYFLAPVSIRFRADLYIDAGFQAVAMFRQETHSKKVDFCFSNYEGSDVDSANTINKTSNWMLVFAGSIHFEVGVRASLSFSILGLHDYLHAEAYAEIFLNASISGMLVADISFRETSTDFSGYICVDAALTMGCRVGLDFKFLFVDKNTNYTLWYIYLLRLKYENNLEHWSDLSEDEIDMIGQTVSLDEYNVLWINEFNSVTMGFEEKKHKANEKYSILSGVLMDQAFIDATSGHIFTYEVLDHKDWLTIDESGVLHVKDGTPSEFDARINIKVSNWVGLINDKVIVVHYTATDMKEVYIQGAISGEHYVGSYRPGYKFKLPEGPKVRGYKFVDYLYNNKSYKAGEEIVMGDETMYLSAFYEVLRKYEVKFYDGNANLVASDIVYEGEDAVAPFEEMRDRFMDTSKYRFISWNRKFTNVHANIDVYGIYLSVGEID